jgi:SWI/SNF-related matrix-associated actin-dependent regulator of chromatin subfamily D
MQAQHEGQKLAIELAKRRSRKPTDKNIPEGVESCIIGDGAQRYKELRDVERKLDAAMMRKRMYIQDSRNSSMKKHRTLRIWVSNTVDDQEWQGDGLVVDAFDFNTNSNASYKVKIEGRLLSDDEDDNEEEEDEDSDDEEDNAKKGTMDRKALRPSQNYALSHFFKSMTVDFDKNRSRDGAEQNVEWKKPALPPNPRSLPPSADFDVLEFKRGGDENQNITINFVRDETPERFTLSPPLAEILDMKEATRAEAVTGIWEYVKVMGLQEDDEKRSFRCDDVLRQVSTRPPSIPHFRRTNQHPDLPTRHRLHPQHHRRHHPPPLRPPPRQPPLHHPRRPRLPQAARADRLRRPRHHRRRAARPPPRLQHEPQLRGHAARHRHAQRRALGYHPGPLALEV